MIKNMRVQVVGVNTLGALGYLFKLTVWMLLVVVVLALITGCTTIPQSVVSPDIPTETSPPASGLAIGVGYGVTIVMATLSLFVVVFLPYWLGKLSARALRRALKVVKAAPTKRHVFLLKSILTAAPLIGFWVVNIVVADLTMTFSVIYIVAVASAVMALVFFLLQLLLARFFTLPDDVVW